MSDESFLGRARHNTGFMLGALGMLISLLIKQLENFAGIMNFVIFPMFFASSALYPLWRVKESSPLLYYVCELNPFTHATELIRFAFQECGGNPRRKRCCALLRCLGRIPDHNHQLPVRALHFRNRIVAARVDQVQQCTPDGVGSRRPRSL